MVKHQSRERGQALVVIVLAVVGLFGFAALALDGGLIYSDRRQAQNAADTAAMAAALAKVNFQQWHSAALNRAASNGYDNNKTSNWVEVYSPPKSGVYSIATEYIKPKEYVQVFIRSQLDTNFAQVVFGHKLETTVESVAHAKPGSVGPLYDGNALVSLATTDCSMLKVGGTQDSVITGGGIFVNSTASCALTQSGGAGTLSAEEGITLVGGAVIQHEGVTPPPAEYQTQMQRPYPPDPDIPLPTCGWQAQVSGNIMTEGWYKGNFPPNSVTELKPGIYCVDGAFRVEGTSKLTGHDVLIYVKGVVSLSGTAEIHLDGPDSGDYEGMLIYSDPKGYPTCVLESKCTVNDVSINGDANSTFEGTIYAPASLVTINGTGEVHGFQSQVVGNKIYLSGTAVTTIDYDDKDNYEGNNPPMLGIMN